MYLRKSLEILRAISNVIIRVFAIQNPRGNNIFFCHVLKPVELEGRFKKKIFKFFIILNERLLFELRGTSICKYRVFKQNVN